MFTRFSLASDLTTRRPALAHHGRRIGTLERIRPRDLTPRAKALLAWKMRRHPSVIGTLQLDSRIFATFNNIPGWPDTYPTFWRLS